MRNIIPIISGKGGVGKSTVASNLAVAIASTGAKVALIDSDFYGPSIPTLFGGGKIVVDEQGKLIPPEKYGVKYISLGFFLQNPDDAVIWRGPMFNKALSQMLNDVRWGEVDYCVVDMPPGTGDAQISLCQMVKIVGAVVVTTPQEVALADVRKAISMLGKVNVPILGLIENMSGFVAPDGTVHEIFGKGGGEALARSIGVELLASIPLETDIRKGGDLGVPVATDISSAAGERFRRIGLKIIDILDKRESSGMVSSGPAIVN
jgi:ATP-binding protein involved in chromosome partitioning